MAKGTDGPDRDRETEGWLSLEGSFSNGLRRARAGRGAQPACILVVDDEPDIVQGMQELLTRSLPHARVLTATTGLEATHVLEREPVDVLVSDYRMPGMDGFELLHRAQRVAPDVTRILVSAYHLELLPDTKDSHRLFAVLRKPLDLRRFVTTVQKALAAAA